MPMITPHQTTSLNLDLFADDSCLYAIVFEEGYVLRIIQRLLSSMG
jgi:hypothetical protein